jgi:hypothetical protein
MARARFDYTKLDFIEIMKRKLALGQESGSWEVALLLSKVLFGDRDAPHEVDDTALMYIRLVIETYKRALNNGESRVAYNGVNFTVETLKSAQERSSIASPVFKSWAA